MAQRYDVSLKSLFLREGDGIIRRLLFGPGKITEFLPTEQPQVFNPRADMVARTDPGGVRQVEFQANNELGFAFRMLEYYPYLVRRYGEPVTQIVLYIGKEPMRLENVYRSASVDYRFEIVNLREFDAETLLESSDLADNILALLAKGSPEKALEIVGPRIAVLRGDDRNAAEASLVLLSGIMGMEEAVQKRLKEFGMINVMENKILGPLIEQRFEQGVSQGLSQGLSLGLSQGATLGRRETLREMLVSRFGVIPPTLEKRLTDASLDQLSTWSKKLMSASSIEEALD